MTAGPTTRPSLLLRLRDPGDRAAWAEFVDLYAPVVFGFARNQGLQEADAADLTQDVFRSVTGAIGRFDYRPADGGFRAWLFEIVKNQLRSHFRRTIRAARRGGGGGVALDELPAPAEPPEDVWEREWRREAFARACEAVRGQVAAATWEAFHRTAVLGQSGREAAAALGVSSAAVYLSRARVLARLREYVAGLERE
jgi:RNA polymerase sigma-70 factor (ECF subfamily)